MRGCATIEREIQRNLGVDRTRRQVLLRSQPHRSDQEIRIASRGRQIVLDLDIFVADADEAVDEVRLFLIDRRDQLAAESPRRAREILPRQSDILGRVVAPVAEHLGSHEIRPDEGRLVGHDPRVAVIETGRHEVGPEDVVPPGQLVVDKADTLAPLVGRVGAGVGDLRVRDPRL